MINYRFTLEAVGPGCLDDDFSEWVASHTGAAGHASRDGRHFIHFVTPADSLDTAVKEAVDRLTGWSGLRVVGFASPCSNSGLLARA